MKENNYIGVLDEELDIWYKINNIVFERNELYIDFFETLFSFISDTYVGEDVLNNKQDITNHFNWCFKRTVETFEKENIFFNENGELRNHLLSYFITSFYKNTNDNKEISSHDFFIRLFTYKQKKTQAELNAYKTVYDLFEMDLKVM